MPIIPTPTVPSATIAVSAVELKATQSNKQFYIYSGLIAADNTETTVISVRDIGQRDILFCLNPILTSLGTDDMTMKVKNNGSIIYQCIWNNQTAHELFGPVHFIFSANTSIEVTFENETGSSSHDVGVSAYGYYL